MLYRFAHVLMWITFRIFFRRIDVVGKGRLPKDRPLILIANHPASFLDAMVLAVFLGRSLHFYVRGDIFKHPLAYRVLTLLHMIPIYSQEHGTQNLWKNKRTFERGRKLLSSGKLLLVFPEGFSRLSKQLVPLKKGAARVALQTAFGEGLNQDLCIQTVAINYSYHGFGADLFIRVGEHMGLEKYRSLFYEQPAQAINSLTRDMQELFERNIIHVLQGDRTAVAEELIRMSYGEFTFQADDFFDRATRICNTVSEMTKDEFEQLDATLSAYHSKLHVLGVDPSCVFKSNRPLHRILIFQLIVLFPVFLLGSLIWFIPGMFSKWIANRTVTRIDFYTSVHSGVMAFVGLIWWGAWIGILVNMKQHPAAALVFISPLFLYVTLFWRRKFTIWRCLLKMSAINKTDPGSYGDLQSLRSSLKI